MKLCLGDIPIKTLFAHTDSDDATIVPSDMQAGTTGYAKGKKVTGTGKAFSFASYGKLETNFPQPVPTMINVIEIASVDYPIKLTMTLTQMKNIDFGVSQNVAEVSINDSTEQITVDVTEGMITVTCSQDIQLQVFYGKDEYV